MRRVLNNAKTALLMSFLMGLFLGIGYLIGGPGAMLPALILGAAVNIAMLYWSDKLALMTMQAHEIGASDDPVLYGMVQRLAKRAGLPMPRVYVSAMEAPNAFATGRSPSHSVVCVTAGLRRILNEQELEGVVAHELSHIKNRDMLIGTIAAIVAGVILWVTRIAYFFGSDEDHNPVASLLLMIFAPIAAMLVQMAISRSREYEADRSGAEMCGKPRSLASALAKLHNGSQQAPLPVNQAQANLFIVQPLTGHRMLSLLSTHPPMEERIQRLLEMENETARGGIGRARHRYSVEG